MQFKFPLFLVSLTIGVISVTQVDAFAHTRRLAFTEEYRTIPKGVFEVESKTKIKVGTNL